MRVPGFEPEHLAWEAKIITTRSYPQQRREDGLPFIEICEKKELRKGLFPFPCLYVF